MVARRGRLLGLSLLGLAALAAACDDGGSAGADGDAAGGGDAPLPLGGCSEADLAACLYPSPPRAFTERESLSVTDPATGRVLPLKARVPEGPGPFPVVVWSHGGGFNAGGAQSAGEWASLLASRGYVVINVAHVPPTAETGPAVCALAAVPEAECTPGVEDDDSPLLAVFKTLDVLAVLDALPALSAASVDQGGPALDLARIAVAGWSAGSRAPVITMGATTRPSASAPPFARPDARVAAAFGLSPTGPGYGGFYDDGAETSWDAMRGPILLMTGTNDVKPNKPGLDGPTRRAPFDAQPGGDARWLLYSLLPVGVGGHATYNLEDAGSPDDRLVRLSQALGSAAVAFLDATLRGDADARAWLDSANAAILAGEADWQHR